VEIEKRRGIPRAVCEARIWRFFKEKKASDDPETEKFLSHITYQSLDIDKEESYQRLRCER